jgi:sugar transferase (PEP-CTERM/EpsH1 system associated)
LSAWVKQKLASDGIDHVFVFSSPMAQYVLDERYRSLRRIVDFVDVDSQKWRQYGEQHKWPMSWMYLRESTKLLQFEREVAQRFDAGVFVSQSEAALFNQLAPEVTDKVSYLSNGVDTEFFSPAREYDNPYVEGELPVVFTGAMDYWANVNAASWFAREIFPAIRAQAPKARFFIVGARPTEPVRRLDRLVGVKVTGTVQDIRPYLFHARMAVAPLKIARGLQNKVLEAMAMAKPVVATPAAMEGLTLPLVFNHLVSDDPAILAERALEVLTKGDQRELGQKGREFVEQTYSWERAWRRLDTLLRGLHADQRVVRLSA